MDPRAPPAHELLEGRLTGNVEARLPDRLARTVAAKMRAAYRADNALSAEADLRAMAADLNKAHPGAAGSLLEGLYSTGSAAKSSSPSPRGTSTASGAC